MYSCLQLSESVASDLVLGNMIGIVQQIFDPKRISKLNDPAALRQSHVLYVHVLARLKSKTSLDTVVRMLQSPGAAPNTLVSSHNLMFGPNHLWCPVQMSDHAVHGA